MCLVAFYYETLFYNLHKSSNKGQTLYITLGKYIWYEIRLYESFTWTIQRNTLLEQILKLCIDINLLQRYLVSANNLSWNDLSSPAICTMKIVNNSWFLDIMWLRFKIAV